MSEEDVHESFLLWENHQSRPLSNSDNNNNSSAGLGSDEDKSAGNNNNQQQQQEDVSQAEPETKKKHKKKRIGCGTGEVISEGKGGDKSDDHEMHIWTERERRKKMRNMFSNLHALLPHLPPKADKATIVDEAVNYIKTLQQTLQNIQKQKLERFHGSINLGFESSFMNTQKQALDSSREAFLADQVSSNDLANNINATEFSNPLSISQLPVTFQTWTSSNVVLNVSGNKAHISVCSPKKPALFTTICYILEKHKIEVISAHVSSYSNHSMLMIQAWASEAARQLLEESEMEEMFKQAAGEIMCWVSS